MKRKLVCLVACEESQAVSNALRALDHEAYSCDLLPCSGGHPEYHLQMDVFQALHFKKWDLIMMHPPCTALAVSGNRWYGNNMPRHQERLDAARWTESLWEQAISVCDHVALENPVGVLNQLTSLPQPQYIQPWMFGHGETKRTGFWRHNLPDLVPTETVEGREQKVWKMGPTKNPKDRAILRSKTYPGIATAIAKQWSEFILNQN